MVQSFLVDMIIIYLLMEYTYGKSATITIPTQLGSVTGIKQNNYGIFKGIPYTEYTPKNDKRFSVSIVKNTSYHNNTYNATYYRPACMQSFWMEPTSEDCLYLNIWSPNINLNYSMSDNLLPVLFWIHGGLFVVGSGSAYPGDSFMNNGNVLYVSINYRLGSLGYLSLKSILNETNNKTTGGMNGIHDQIVALEWIQKYIHDFGGDRNHVTIFGESSGSISVCLLLISNLAQNLFDQAIMQSDSCVGTWSAKSYHNGLNVTRTILHNAGLSENLTELRQLNATSFLSLDVPVSIDGYILTESASDIYNNKVATNKIKINANKMIIGYTSVDSVYSFPFFLTNKISQPPSNGTYLRYYLETYIRNSSQIDVLINSYYPIEDFNEFIYINTSLSNYAMLWYSMNADLCVICPSMNLGKIIQQNDQMRNNVYLYQFNGAEFPYYVPHGGDLPFLFNKSDVSYVGYYFGIPWNQLLSDFFVNTWKEYAIYGNFNKTMNSWTPFGMNGTAMIFSGNNGYSENLYDTKYRNGVCNFWIQEVGWKIMTNLCDETLSVEFLGSKSDKIQTWIIVVILLTVIMLLIGIGGCIRVYKAKRNKISNNFSEIIEQESIN